MSRLSISWMSVFAIIGLLVASSAGWAVDYEYDALDRLTRVVYDDGATIEYTYDPAGNILSRAVPEPSAAALAGCAALTLLALARRRRRPAVDCRRGRLGATASLLTLALALSALPREAAEAANPAAGSAAATRSSTSTGIGSGPEPTGWLERAGKAIRESEYEVSWRRTKLRSGREAWQAPNRAHNFRTHFLDEGIRLTPRDGAEPAWEFGLALQSYGRGAHPEATEPGPPRADGRHGMRYQRGGVVEWYRNDANGLKQGFTLEAPPSSDRRGGGPGPNAMGGREAGSAGNGGSVYVALRVDGDVQPVLTADGRAVDFVRGGEPIAVAHYAGLVVRDARGEELPSWMEVFREGSAHGIRLVLDDTNALYPVEIDPLVTTPSWSIASNQDDASLGQSVAGAGDVNGDGFDDVLIGAPWFDGGRDDSGRAYLFFGSPAGLSQVPDWFGVGENPPGTRNPDPGGPFSRFGWSVAGAGDVNGDDFDDILVSRIGTQSGPAGRGIAFLYLGSELGPAEVSDWTLIGRNNRRLGVGLAGIGDVNGDGLDDIAIGEPGVGNQFEQGRVYVFYGEESGLLGGGNRCSATEESQASGANCTGGTGLEQWDPTVWGFGSQNDGFGAVLAAAGDVNCDGFADLVVGQPSAGTDCGNGSPGRVSVWSGGPTGIDTDTTLFFEQFSTSTCDDQFGASVAGAGALDTPAENACFGDAGGVPDSVLAGAPGDDGNGADNGDVWLIRGSASGSLQREPDPVFEGSRAGEAVGRALARVGDVNGDGADDFIIGAPGDGSGATAETKRGRAFLLLGPTGGNAISGNPAWRSDGVEADERHGFAVGGAGDVDADGYADVVIGAPGPGGTQPGSAFVFRGVLPLTADLLADFLGGGSDSLAIADWRAGIRGQTTPPGPEVLETSSSPAVAYGSGGALVSTGLAQDLGAGSTDWDRDDQPDQSSLQMVLGPIPPGSGSRTLRFTTQFLTAESNGEEDEASLRYEYGLSSTKATQLASPLILDTPIQKTGSGPIRSPVTHGIDITGKTNIGLQVKMKDAVGTAGDSALRLSRVFFSDVPLPAYLGTDEYVKNPRPSDVRAAVGTFGQSNSVLNVPGKGMPFDLTLSYNSERVREEDLGAKWSHSYSVQADSFPDGTIESLDDADNCPDKVNVWLGAGRLEAFKQSTEDLDPASPCDYEPEFPGLFSTLRFAFNGSGPEDNLFTHTDRRNMVTEFLFDRVSPGGLISIYPATLKRDPNGNEIKFKYEGDQLSEITDTRGELFRFTYDSAGRLERVNNVGAEVTFGYGLNDLLTSITDPNGLETTFVYDDDAKLLSITDADGTVLVSNDYEQGEGEAGSRVVRQRNANLGDLGRSTRFDGDDHLVRDRENGVELSKYDVFGRRVERRLLLDAGAEGLDPGDPLDSCTRADDWCAIWNFEYDEDDNLIREVDPRGFVSESVFDDQRNMICRTENAEGPDAEKLRRGMVYDDRNNLVEQAVRLDGALLPDCPDPETGIAAAQEARWLIQRFTYDAADNLISQTDAEGNATAFSYDSEGLLESRTDADLQTFEYTYDPLGYRKNASDPLGNTARYTHNVMGRRTATQDPRGFASYQRFDAGGRLTSTIDAVGAIESFEYDAQGRPLVRTDAVGERWERVYTPTGQLERDGDPLGNEVVRAYDKEDRLTRVTDARGNATEQSYDAAGRRAAIVDVQGGVTSFGYDKAGNVESVTDPLGNKSETDYDALGRVTAERDANGDETTYTYDPRGLELTRTEPHPLGPAVWERSYTPNGNLAQSTDPTAVVSTATYDSLDRLVQLRDEVLGRETDYEYDPLGRMTRVQSPVPAPGVARPEAQATYDEAGNRTSVTDPNLNATAFEFDALGRVTRETDPEGNSIETTYEPRGLVASRTNARGQTIEYGYDAAERQASMSFAGPGAWAITEELDPNGNATASTATGDGGFVSVARAFDTLDRQVERAVEYEPGLTRTSRSEYDAAGNMTAVVYSDGKRVTYTYDLLNRIDTVTDWDGRVTAYDYDSVGNLTAVRPPDGSEATYSYDRANRLTAIHDQRAASTIFRADFTLDDAGRRVGANLSLPLELQLSGAEESFAYDAANRMTSRAGGSSAVVHDDDGNVAFAQVGGAPLTLGYNELNQLEAVNGDAIRYDADGLRVERIQGSSVVRYLYDAQGRLLEELDGSGNVTARYVHGLGLISREDAATSDVAVYHYDSRGSAVALTDLGGTVTDRYAYAPFGGLVARTGSTPNPFTYNGRDGVIDDGNGLYYMRARYYAPELMRFIQKDPAYAGELEFPQSLNRYAFVEGNPIERIDPRGEAFQLLTALAGAAVGAAVDVGFQVLLEGKSLDELDLARVAGAAVEGAIFGSGGGFLLGAAAGVAGEATTQALRGDLSVSFDGGFSIDANATELLLAGGLGGGFAGFKAVNKSRKAGAKVGSFIEGVGVKRLRKSNPSLRRLVSESTPSMLRNAKSLVAPVLKQAAKGKAVTDRLVRPLFFDFARSASRTGRAWWETQFN